MRANIYKVGARIVFKESDSVVDEAKVIGKDAVEAQEKAKVLFKKQYPNSGEIHLMGGATQVTSNVVVWFDDETPEAQAKIAEAQAKAVAAQKAETPASEDGPIPEPSDPKAPKGGKQSTPKAEKQAQAPAPAATPEQSPATPPAAQ